MDDSTQKTLWVGNLDEKVNEDLLYELFLQAGPLESVVIPKDKKGGGRKNFAFVMFKHPESVNYTLSLMEGITMFGKKLRLERRPGAQEDNTYVNMMNVHYKQMEQQYLEMENRRLLQMSSVTMFNSRDAMDVRRARMGMHERSMSYSLGDYLTPQRGYRRGPDLPRYESPSEMLPPPPGERFGPDIRDLDRGRRMSPPPRFLHDSHRALDRSRSYPRGAEGRQTPPDRLPPPPGERFGMDPRDLDRGRRMSPPRFHSDRRSGRHSSDRKREHESYGHDKQSKRRH